MRRRSVLVALALLAPLLAGCGDNDGARQEALDAIAATEALARSFSYEEATRDRTVEVKGLIEDDFRFTALSAVDGDPQIEQVVVDDAISVRLLDDGLRAQIDRVDGADAKSDLDGVTVGEALAARRWVLDEVGAPAVTTTADDFDNLGFDPVRDARTVLDYVERSISSSFRVVRFNPDSLDYKPSEDPFDTPGESSDVIRYDVQARFLPRPSDVGTGATPPGTSNLRKMSLYVEDGLVIRVVERIAAEGDVGDRLADYLQVATREFDPEQGDQLKLAIETVSEEERGPFLIELLNGFLDQLGEDPVRPRDMRIDFTDLGEAEAADLPEGAIKGSLELLRPPEEDETVTSGDELAAETQAAGADEGEPEDGGPDANVPEEGEPGEGEARPPEETEPADDGAAEPTTPSPSP